jgi:Uncharacterized protein conserved in bacteria
MKSNCRRLFAIVLVVSFIYLVGCSGKTTTQDDSWKPTKTVTFYLYAGPGGDTDTAMRALAAVWQEEYGVTFNVVNMTGGAGGIAANYVYGQPSDGYTLFGMADGCSTMNVLGAFDYTNDVWDLMVLFGGVGCIGVPSDSPYNTLEDLINAAKSGTNIRLSCSSAGTIWHVDAAQMADQLGVTLNILPYDGSNQAIIGLLSGEVDVVCSSLGEQTEYIKSGDIRPLAVLADSDRKIDGYDGTIPSIQSIYPEFVGFSFARQWNGVGIKNDTDQKIKDFYEKAFMDAVKSGKLDNVKTTRNTEYIGLIGDEARTFVNTCTSACSWTLWDLGVAAKSPEEFGIER